MHLHCRAVPLDAEIKCCVRLWLKWHHTPHTALESVFLACCQNFTEQVQVDLRSGWVIGCVCLFWHELVCSLCWRIAMRHAFFLLISKLGSFPVYLPHRVFVYLRSGVWHTDIALPPCHSKYTSFCEVNNRPIKSHEGGVGSWRRREVLYGQQSNYQRNVCQCVPLHSQCFLVFI